MPNESAPLTTRPPTSPQPGPARHGPADNGGEDEAARLSALRRAAILDTPPEAAFDEITRLAAQICQTPMAAISFVDDVRQWFKSAHGMDLKQTPREISFCTHAIRQHGVMIVPDAHADDRFAASPLVVGEPHIRFYAGAVVKDGAGHALGTLCVLDRVPRQLEESQIEALAVLARQVEAQLLLRRAVMQQAMVIDELSRTREHLRRHRDELADFVENGGVGLHWVGPDNRIIWANSAEMEMLGYTREQYIGHDISEFYADPDVIQDMLRRLHDGETLHNYPARMRHRSGSIRHVLVTSNVYWRDGQFIHTRCFTRDVTDLQRAIERLNLYREIFANSNDGIAIIGTDGRYIEQNPAHQALTGFNDAELRGQTPAIHLGQEAFARIANELARHGTFSGEAVSHTRSGRDVPIELSAFSVRDQAGEPIYYVGLKRDISLRRAAEQALRNSEARYRSIFQNVIDSIITIDEMGVIESVNPVTERMFGYSAEEMIGRNVSMLMPPPYSVEHDEYLARYRRTGEQRIIGHGREVLGRRSDGETFPVDLAVSELHLDDRRVFVGLIRDVTERRRAERERERLLAAERRARAEAEQASNAKDQFLAVLSHELRTPLTPALTIAQMLESDPQLPAEMLEPIATMRRNIELETRLIDDMLDVTRIARGKVEIEPVPLNLHEKIRHVLTICDKDIANKGLELQVDLAAADPRLSGDPARLQQVLWNLIKNAVKFTPDGGRIAVRTRQETQGALTIEVSDTGVGIEPQMLSRIFQAFEQGGRDVTRRFGGLGLGLTISKALVELHGGILTAQSAGPGQGSTFTVVLPRRHIAAAAPEAASLAGASVKAQCRILLVEDHHDTGRAMARVLAAAGHHVRTADTVGSALRLALSEPFDLIISDIGLPDGSGLDLMRQLRPHTRVKGIALSGFGRDDDIRRSKQAGFDMHLTKPVNLTRLKEAIQRLMV